MTDKDLEIFLRDYVNQMDLPVFAKSFMKIALSKELSSLFKRYSSEGKMNVDAFVSSWLLPKLF